MAPNRIVALATPLAAPLAGAFAAWLSQHLPGAAAQQEAIEETFLAVTGLVVALALQFNHNRFKWDVTQHEAVSSTTGAAVAPVEIDDEPALPPALEPLDLDEVLDDDEVPDMDLDFGDEDDEFDDELDGAADGVVLDGEAEQAARDAASGTDNTTIR